MKDNTHGEFEIADTTDEPLPSPPKVNSEEVKQRMRQEMDQLNMDNEAGDEVDLGMIIDLHRCSGCSACNIACKRENNVQEGHAWASRIVRTEGTFPNVRWEYIPTLCNQCRDAPCATGCPTNSLYKGTGGVTMHDPDLCIGCKYCQINCPYDAINLNSDSPHQFWSDEESLMEGTASPAETADAADVEVIPHYNPNREVAEHEDPLRYKGIVEKCNFCIHRVQEGELPACVEACPHDARIFGDLNDSESAVSKLRGRYEARGLKEELGTEPKVRYIRTFNQGGYKRTKGDINSFRSETQ